MTVTDSPWITAAPPDLTVTVTNHQPAPQGSKAKSRYGAIIDDNPRTKPWRKAVDTAARAAMNARFLAGTGEERPDRPLCLDGPLCVEAAFTVPKPASAPKTRMTWPTTRTSGDIDKLLRSTLDALTTSGAIADDARIVEVIARKMHPGEGIDALDAPGAVIRIWRLS